MTGEERPARAPLPREPLECRQLAEDTDQPQGERLIWAILAVAGELHTIRRELRRKG